MATEPIPAMLDIPAVRSRRIANSNALFDYWELTKPEINFLIAITAATGFWLGSSSAFPHFQWMSFVHMLLGTVLVASGAAALNQLIELQYDAQMRRTARRPLVSGRIAPSRALRFGVLLSVFGVVYLAISTNALASLLAALTLLGYLYGSLGAFRDCFPLAISSFHVHRVDLSRRLLSRRLPGLACGRTEGWLRRLAIRAADPGSFCSRSGSCYSW